MPRREERTYSAAARAEAKVLAAQRELREEPMRRWPHPIPLPCPQPCHGEDGGRTLTAILEALQCQNQLLVDLLEAVNGLTAATLARRESPKP